MEEGRPESKQRLVSPMEDVLENIETISRLSGEIIDAVKGKSPRNPANRRSPDERVNRKVKGDVLTSTMPNNPSPRRYHQSKELKIQSTSFEVPHTSHRPPSPQPPPPEAVNVSVDEETSDFSRHPDEGEASIQTTSGDIESLYLKKNVDEKNEMFPTTLSLEEYQQRGNPRKKTPKSAVKDSLKFEQRLSRMKSAPQHSPTSPRTSNLRESGEVFNPILAIDANRRPLCYSESPALPLGLDRKEQNISTRISSSPKQLKEEEKRIKKNIWNNPLCPLPKIGVLKQMRDQTAISELAGGCNDDKTGTYTYVSKAKKHLSSFIKESLPEEDNHSVNGTGSMLETPFMTNAIATNASDDQLEGIYGDVPFSNENNLVSSGRATKVESNTILGVVEVATRSGGLAYFFTSSQEKHETKLLLPSCLQVRVDRSQKHAQGIRCNLELKNTLMKTNLEKIELARKKKRTSFEAHYGEVQQRRQELLDNRQLKLTFSMKCKQGKAKHNKEVIQKKKEDGFRLVQERRNMLRMRKEVLREIRKPESMEETVTDLETYNGEENPNLPPEDVEDQDEQVGEQNKESKDGVILEPAEGEDRGKEDGDGVSRDDEGERKDESERQVEEEGDDHRMDETDNGNHGNGCDTENDQRGDGRFNIADAAEGTVDGDRPDSNNSEDNTENHQILVSGSAQGDATQRRVDEDSNSSDENTEHIRVMSGSLVEDGDYQEDRIRRGEAYQNIRHALELEAQYQIDLQNDLDPTSASSMERRGRQVAALLYYSVAIRAVQDQIGDLSARRTDGISRTGLLPILFEESQPAMGDYFAEGDDTPSDTDDEYHEMGLEESVDTVPVEREFFQGEYNDASRRSRFNRRGH